MRVAIIGARRVRQGLGPYLARFVAEAGHDVVAVVGTTPQTAREAADALATGIGRPPRAATTMDEVVDAGAEALVIASPHRTHGRWIEHALAHRLHVLCEKPLLWGPARPAEEALRLACAFVERELVLTPNTQWPETLDAYRELFPQLASRPQRFFMQQPPRTTGFAALLDCLSHPASLLALVPFDESVVPDLPRRRHPDIRDLRFVEGGPEAVRWDIRFALHTGDLALDVRLVLDASPDAERRTTYGFDGDLATRVVDPRDYSMTLEGAERSIPLPDPTERLVRSFLFEATRSPRDLPRFVHPDVTFGMPFLETLVTAAAHHYGVPRP